MVATYEEKIGKLKQHENWWAFTDPQRVFLDGIANGMTPLDAAKRAYPDCKNGVTLTKHILCRVGIQKALATIGVDVKQANVTKNEALEMLSRQLRKQAIEPDLMVKLLSLYAKMSGWNKEEEDEDPGEEVNLDKLVTAMEKKRKQNA